MHTYHQTLDELDNLETIPFAPLDELEKARRRMQSHAPRALGWFVARRHRIVALGLTLGVGAGIGLPMLLSRLF
ncbi:MAG: hypothetical protein KC503_08360 [Myxococcales bacterium]|nr:hypothetical protein [Myxococcales bacterium]